MNTEDNNNNSNSNSNSNSSSNNDSNNNASSPTTTAVPNKSLSERIYEWLKSAVLNSDGSINLGSQEAIRALRKQCIDAMLAEDPTLNINSLNALTTRQLSKLLKELGLKQELKERTFSFASTAPSPPPSSSSLSDSKSSDIFQAVLVKDSEPNYKLIQQLQRRQGGGIGGSGGGVGGGSGSESTGVADTSSTSASAVTPTVPFKLSESLVNALLSIVDVIFSKFEVEPLTDLEKQTLLTTWSNVELQIDSNSWLAKHLHLVLASVITAGIMLPRIANMLLKRQRNDNNK